MQRYRSFAFSFYLDHFRNKLMYVQGSVTTHSIKMLQIYSPQKTAESQFTKHTNKIKITCNIFSIQILNLKICDFVNVHEKIEFYIQFGVHLTFSVPFHSRCVVLRHYSNMTPSYIN